MSAKMICIPRQVDGRWRHEVYYRDHAGRWTYDPEDDGSEVLVEESQVPMVFECKRAWDDYQRYIAETGQDPLDEAVVAAGFAPFVIDY